ncbi:mandelate racemase/muconate lactonizing enzyme family protein [Caldalkalibacillus salinus]|uniref:mandelate racemase/muconate lactonizing enzyme family protein n=1 Tax=Caldalkalibacillus salinus TaxID=2803787 RepID=UPI00192429E4|nr:mandelate racemase/muconate lactonizing enzyme family protein [Caldalkalibacillus salinus]
MYIQQVDTFPLLYRIAKPYGDANGLKEYRSCYIIRITTQDGVHGWGECIDWLPTLHLGFEKRIIPYLIGQSVQQHTMIVQTIKKWHHRAASAVSMALMDLLAQYAQVHLTDLYGGMLRENIPVYASFQSYSDQTDWMNLSLRKIEQTLQNNYSMLKVKIGGRSLKEDQAHIKQCMDLMSGQDVQLAVDANQSYDLSTAKRWTTLFEQYEQWLWFEEPLPLNDIIGYQALNAALSLPIAAGENLTQAPDFIPLLSKVGVDIFQPDIGHHEGLDEYRTTVNMVRAHGRRVSPHAFDGGLSLLHALCIQCCLPSSSKMGGDDIEPVEWDVMENPFHDLIPIKPRNGVVHVPKGIGLGVELNQKLLQQYAWDGSLYQA